MTTGVRAAESANGARNRKHGERYDATFADDLPRRALHIVALAYVATIPWDILPVAFGVTLTVPFAFLLIATWLLNGLRHPRAISVPAAPAILLLAYCLWATLTVLWSADAEYSWIELRSLLVQPLLLVVLSNSMTAIWFKSLITLGLSSAVVGIAILGNPGDPTRENRASLAGANENYTALHLALGFAALVYTSAVLGGKKGALLLIPVAVTGTAVLHTGSRAGSVAVAAVLLLGIVQHTWMKRRRLTVWLTTTLTLVLSFALYNWAWQRGLIPSRVLDLFGQLDAYDDSGRSAINGLYLRTFDTWSVYGVGFGGEKAYLLETQGIAKSVHNLYLSLWVETGLIGLCLFMTFVFLLIRNGFRCASPSALLLISVPIVIMANTTGLLLASASWFVAAFAVTSVPKYEYDATKGRM